MPHYRILPPVFDSSKNLRVMPSAIHSLEAQTELRQQALQALHYQKHASVKSLSNTNKSALQRQAIPALLILATLTTLAIWFFL